MYVSYLDEDEIKTKKKKLKTSIGCPNVLGKYNSK